MNTGPILKILRVASNLKQSTLARELNVTANYLSLLENGKREPSLTFLKNFSQKLGVPLGYMLWVALEDPHLPEEFQLQQKMEHVLTTLLRNRNKPTASVNEHAAEAKA